MNYNYYRQIAEKYLGRRGRTLSTLIPQWYFTNEEIEKSKDVLKRDCTSICIPPSWDVVGRFAGSEESEGGSTRVNYNVGKANYTGGELGESDFLETIRGLKLGGILLGDINSQQMQRGYSDQEENDFILPDNLRHVVKTGNSL